LTPPASALLRLADVELYLRARDPDREKLPGLIVRGLPTQDVLLYGVDRMIVLTTTPGPGFTVEQHFSGNIVNVRCVGAQNDYDDAENLAADVDGLMLADGNVQVGSRAALYVTHAGGPPAPFMKDSALRTHFGCSYVIPIASGR
jgi:hypothetical protein